MGPRPESAESVNLKQNNLRDLMLGNDFFPQGLGKPNFRKNEINSDHKAAKIFLDLGVHLEIPSQYSLGNEITKFNQAANASLKAIFTMPGGREATWYDPTSNTNNKESQTVIDELVSNLKSSRSQEKLTKEDLDVSVVAAFSAGRPDVAFKLIKQADKFSDETRRIIMEYVSSDFLGSVVDVCKKYKLTDGIAQELRFFKQESGESIQEAFKLDIKDVNDKKIIDYLSTLFDYAKGVIQTKPVAPEISYEQLLKRAA